jgi:hypothetical protein
MSNMKLTETPVRVSFCYSRRKSNKKINRKNIFRAFIYSSDYYSLSITVIPF